MNKTKDGKKEIGRLADGELVPYWSRAEIEKRNLLAGQEMGDYDKLRRQLRFLGSPNDRGQHDIRLEGQL